MLVDNQYLPETALKDRVIRPYAPEYAWMLIGYFVRKIKYDSLHIRAEVQKRNYEAEIADLDAERKTDVALKHIAAENKIAIGNVD